MATVITKKRMHVCINKLFILMESVW